MGMLEPTTVFQVGACRPKGLPRVMVETLSLGQKISLVLGMKV